MIPKQVWIWHCHNRKNTRSKPRSQQKLNASQRVEVVERNKNSPLPLLSCELLLFVTGMEGKRYLLILKHIIYFLLRFQSFFLYVGISSVALYVTKIKLFKIIIFYLRFLLRLPLQLIMPVKRLAKGSPPTIFSSTILPKVTLEKKKISRNSEIYLTRLQCQFCKILKHFLTIWFH